MSGREAIKQFVRRLYTTIPDMTHNTPEDVIFQGDRVVVRHTVSRADPEQNRRVEAQSDLRGAHIYVGSRFTVAMGAAAKCLRLIQVAGAGTDGIDPNAIPAHAICANTFGHEDSIAEYVAAGAILIRRGLLAQDRALRTDRWIPAVESGLIQARGLSGALVGLVGFGHIGAAVWRALQALGMRRTSFVRREGVVPQAVHHLHRLLVAMLPAHDATAHQGPPDVPPVSSTP